MGTLRTLEKAACLHQWEQMAFNCLAMGVRCNKVMAYAPSLLFNPAEKNSFSATLATYPNLSGGGGGGAEEGGRGTGGGGKG